MVTKSVSHSPPYGLKTLTGVKLGRHGPFVKIVGIQLLGGEGRERGGGGGERGMGI